MGVRQTINLDGPLAPEPFDNGKVSACGPDVNPLGVLSVSEMSLQMGTGFIEFRSPEPLSLGGLVKVRPGHVEILAIGSGDPGKGHFTRFITALEPMAGKVTFWAMMSGTFADTLKARGYKSVKLDDPFGKRHECMTKTVWEDSDAEVQSRDSDAGTEPLARRPQEEVELGEVRPERRLILPDVRGD